jgi:hypothetical protein
VSEYKSAIGPIPDEWFENDTGPDERFDKMRPAGFLEQLKATLLQAPPAQQQQSSPDSPSSNPEAKYGR